MRQLRQVATAVTIAGFVALAAAGPAEARSYKRCATPVKGPEQYSGTVKQLAVSMMSCKRAGKLALYSLDRQTYDIPGWSCRRLTGRYDAECRRASARFRFAGNVGGI